MSERRNMAIIVLLGIAVYFNSLFNAFVWDDVFTVIQNDFIKGFRLIPQIFLKPFFYFSGEDYLYYRPIEALSFVFDYSVFGLRPFGFHLVNILLHILAAILVYRFIYILFSERELAFFSALLFTVHPVNASVVNCVTSRADILLVVFALSSLILFIRAKNSLSRLLSLACFILSLLSKETALVFPLFLVFTQEIYARVNKKEAPAGRVRLWYLLFMLIPFVYILFRKHALGSGFSVFLPPGLSIPSIMLTWSKITLNYLGLIYWPSGLHMLRNIPIVKTGDPMTPAYLLFIIFVAGIVLKNLRKMILLFSLGIFFIWLIPAGALAFKNPEYYLQGMAIMEWNWLYIPALGVFLGTVYFLRKTQNYVGKLFCRILFFAFIACLAGITWRENGRWKNNYTLFTHTNKYVHNSVTVYMNLGSIYLNRNDINNALGFYRQALELAREDKTRMAIYKDIAYAYILDNHPDQALAVCREAIRINYNSSDIHALLGLIYARSNLAQAKNEWLIALGMDPFNAIAFNQLLVLSSTEKDIKEELCRRYGNLLKEYRGFERYKVYRSLGMIYLYCGEGELALLNLKEAQRINPYDSTTNKALAVYYARNSDRKRAFELFHRALRLNPFDREVYANLSLFYAESGQKEAADRMKGKAQQANIFN